MPDFGVKQFVAPDAFVNAYQRKAQLQNEMQQQQQTLATQMVDAIGKVGTSLYDRKKQVANALLVKKNLFPGVDEKDLQNLDADTMIKLYGAKNKVPDFLTAMAGANPSLMKEPWFAKALQNSLAPQTEAVLPPPPAQPPVVPSPAQTPVPRQQEPFMTMAPPPPSVVPSVQTPASPMMNPLTPGTTSQTPSPADLIKLLAGSNPTSATTNAMMKMAQANREVPVMTTAEGLAAGSVPKGTVLRDLPKDIMDPATQQKLEKQYTDIKMRALSNRSGGLGLQDSKVNQAVDLRKLVNKYYDQKTGEFNVPPSQHAELALGLARLVSPTGQVGIELMHELRQSTGREAISKALIYAGADPMQVGGPTQNVVRMFIDSIDRQGETAEQLRDQYMQYISDNAPTDLDPARKAKHDKGKINSFNEFLANSPDKVTSGINLQGSDASRLAELRAKKVAGTLKK